MAGGLGGQPLPEFRTNEIESNFRLLLQMMMTVMVEIQDEIKDTDADGVDGTDGADDDNNGDNDDMAMTVCDGDDGDCVRRYLFVDSHRHQHQELGLPGRPRHPHPHRHHHQCRMY